MHFLMGIAVAGCAHYCPLPLNTAAVDHALSLPDNQELQRRVATLGNPLLRNQHFDLTNGMDAGEAAVLAVVLSPELQAERNRVDLADAQLLQASLLPNPSLTFSLDEPFGANSRGQVSGYAVGLDWEFSSLITHGALAQAAGAAESQVRLNVAWKEWQAAESARQAFYDVVLFRAQLADVQQVSGELDHVADLYHHALAAGDVTRADQSAAAVASQDARVELKTAERDLHDAELTLNQSLGAAAETRIPLDSGAALPSAPIVSDTSTYLKNLENRRIDLIALRRGYDSQEASVRAAVLAQFPKLTFGLSQTRDYGNFLTLGPTAAMELPIFNRNQGNIAIEKATRGQLHDEYVAREFEARSDICRCVSQIHSIQGVLATQAREVDDLKSLVKSCEAALRGGNVDAQTFYIAALNLSQKQADLTKLKQEWVHAIIGLELASGASLEDVGPSTTVVSEATR